MGWITTGTVNLTQGSNVVTGVGSKFLEDGRIGDGFRGPNGAIYEVINIATNTGLTIQPAYEGASVNGAAYYLVPIEGYVKDSADQLRTATKQIALIPGTKQDKNTKLTSLVDAQGTAEGVVPYLRGAAATAYSFASLVSSLTDASVGRIMTTGYGGLGASNNATYYPGTQNPDAFIVGAISYWATWNVANISAGITGFLMVQAGESGNLVQTLVDRTTNIQYQRTRNSNVWGEWRALFMSGDNGIGIALYSRQLAPDASLSSTYKDSGAAFAYTAAGPNNGNDAAYSTLSVNGAYAAQILHDMNYNELYTRVKFGNSVGPWVKQISASNAVGDVTVTNGGIMSYDIISGWSVTRYRNGVVVMVSTFQAIGAQWAAGELRIVDVTLPAAFLTTKPYIASASCVPGSVYDFQMHTAWLPSAGNFLRFALRNGATAQTFNASMRVEGAWK